MDHTYIASMSENLGQISGQILVLGVCRYDPSATRALNHRIRRPGFRAGTAPAMTRVRRRRATPEASSPSRSRRSRDQSIRGVETTATGTRQSRPPTSWRLTPISHLGKVHRLDPAPTVQAGVGGVLATHCRRHISMAPSDRIACFLSRVRRPVRGRLTAGPGRTETLPLEVLR